MALPPAVSKVVQDLFHTGTRRRAASCRTTDVAQVEGLATRPRLNFDDATGCRSIGPQLGQPWRTTAMCAHPRGVMRSERGSFVSLPANQVGGRRTRPSQTHRVVRTAPVVDHH
jgi:hypothetical protein